MIKRLTMVEYRRLSKNEASFYLFKLKLSVLQELLLFLKRITLELKN